MQQWYAPQKLDTFGVYIFMGKLERKNRCYSAEFKIGVIMDMRERHLVIVKRDESIGILQQVKQKTTRT